MRPAVRRLGPGDGATLGGLLDVFADAFGEPETSRGRRRAGEVARVLGLEHVIVLVAETAGVVAGGLVAYVLDKIEQPRPEIYLYDLAVAERFRRTGIATALIEALREIAAQAGASVIFVQADHGDDPAIALYTRLGTREDVMHFDIAVGPRSGG